MNKSSYEYFYKYFTVIHAESGVPCKDQQGRIYEDTFIYIPGPEPCTYCLCDNGNPKWCGRLVCNRPEVFQVLK